LEKGLAVKEEENPPEEEKKEEIAKIEE